METRLSAVRKAILELSAEELLVLTWKLGGPEDMVSRNIEESGDLPDNADQIAFEMQETLRKLHRKL
ncbi:hypothetical protein [Streptomyces sp. CoH17]|uniref:hypothetical protein n=1 Tax=Streptomyces sp. CoH17 TaxID=2992806 RepID=UPI00226F9677|nr:hypothetical protein [Streptomyces sp. CoH17]